MAKTEDLIDNFTTAAANAAHADVRGEPALELADQEADSITALVEHAHPEAQDDVRRCAEEYSLRIIGAAQYVYDNKRTLGSDFLNDPAKMAEYLSTHEAGMSKTERRLIELLNIGK